ncbi:MAG: thioredoxin family protein [Bacteroidetes bacterium]|nr:thioredoxin family protein [Bacteroidota bacterium]
MKLREVIQDWAFLSFHSPTCSSCQTMIPLVEDLEKQFSPLIYFFSIDVEVHNFFVSLYNIQSVPSYILFHKGEIVWRKTGLFTKSEFRDLLIKFSITPDVSSI